MSAEQTVRLDSQTPITVTGTVTTSGTSTTKIVDATGDTLAIRADGSITTSTLPEGALPYTTLIRNTLGVVAANNFLSIFNPVGSGKNVVFVQFVCFPYATAATTPTDNMEVWRVSAATVGTQLAAANIGKFDTTQPNSIAEVRTGNPTTTLVGTVPVLAIPPAVTSAPGGVSSTVNIVPPNGALFTCRPGEGIVARTPAGAVGQDWTLGFSWLEM
jgi:hypothetical protein